MSRPVKLKIRTRKGVTTLKVLELGAKGRPVPARVVEIPRERLNDWLMDESTLRQFITGQTAPTE